MVETLTQYIEYLFDLPSDEDQDWQTENYSYVDSGLILIINTRITAGGGISRVSKRKKSNSLKSTWQASFVMSEIVDKLCMEKGQNWMKDIL